MSVPAVVTPLAAPPDAIVRVPGSKSLTNRALLCAALATGVSTITGALVADDTEAMAGCLRALGAGVRFQGDVLSVRGTGRPSVPRATLDCRQSGTTARFLLPAAALGTGTYVLDGSEQLRRRPMAPTVEALRTLGAAIDGDALPLTVRADGLRGGTVVVRADASSQFVSGLLLSGPLCDEGLVVEVEGPAVSRPYFDLTIDVMRAFGASVVSADHERFTVAPHPYRGTEYAVEPDASAAVYFWAAAALTGGRVTVEGIGAETAQGDARFVDVLELMGATVERTAGSITVQGPPSLRGIDVDLADLPDTAVTVAVLAAFASSPTTVRGVGFIREHETDRIQAVASELGRVGVRVDVTDDGWVIQPGAVHGAVVESYDDHRMAMSLALLGLRVDGVRVTEPQCVAKTFPGFWDVLGSLQAR